MMPDRFCACNRGATAFVALMIPNGNCNGLSPNLWNFNVFPIKPVSVAIAPFRLTTQCCVRLASNFGNERHSAIRNVTLFCVSNLIFFFCTLLEISKPKLVFNADSNGEFRCRTLKKIKSINVFSFGMPLTLSHSEYAPFRRLRTYVFGEDRQNLISRCKHCSVTYYH